MLHDFGNIITTITTNAYYQAMFMNFFHFAVRLHTITIHPDFLLYYHFWWKKVNNNNISTSVYLASKGDGTLWQELGTVRQQSNNCWTFSSGKTFSRWLQTETN